MQHLFLLLILAACMLIKGEEVTDHEDHPAEVQQIADQYPFMLYPSHGFGFQRQLMPQLARNNWNFFYSPSITTTTTTSTVTCTISTAVQCMGRRRREVAIEDHVETDVEPSLESEDTELNRAERMAAPSFLFEPFQSYYHPRYVIEPSFERAGSPYIYPKRLNSPFIAQPPEMARFLFGGYTFTSTFTITTTSTWRPICSFPGSFQVCPSK